MLLRLVFALLLSLTLSHSFTQDLIHGEVKSANNVVIPSASVEYLHHQIGCMADATGKFKIEKIVGDTVEISSVGFITTLLAVQENTVSLQAVLTEDAKLLKEVTVSTKKMKTVSLGFYSGYPFFRDYRGPGTENSILIPNEDHLEGYITEIRFKLINAENSPWNLRLRLREIDTATGFPSNGLPLFDGTISASQISKGNRIDIKDRNILLPQVGIFATLEWLDVDATKKIPSHVFVTPAIPGKKVSERKVYFKYSRGSDWQSCVSPDNPYSYFASNEGKNLYAPNISILVSTPKK